MTASVSEGGAAQTGLTTASDSFSDGTVSQEAVASLPAGHLGASAVNNGTGTITSLAIAGLSLSVSNALPGDFIQVQTTLTGSFAPVLGDGATLSLYVVANSGLTQTSAISCSYFSQINTGSACSSQVYGQDINTGSSQLIFDIPLDNVDTLSLQWNLQVGAGSNGSASYLDSADFTITVPEGTSISGNPGGTLFQTASPVPVPDSLSLLVIGTIATGLLARRRRTDGVQLPA